MCLMFIHNTSASKFCYSVVVWKNIEIPFLNTLLDFRFNKIYNNKNIQTEQ